jgi:hypothetical protein
MALSGDANSAALSALVQTLLEEDRSASQESNTMSRQGCDHRIRNIMSHLPPIGFKAAISEKATHQVPAEVTERVSPATAFGQLHPPIVRAVVSAAAVLKSAT